MPSQIRKKTNQKKKSYELNRESILEKRHTSYKQNKVAILESKHAHYEENKDVYFR